jgi:cell division protein FtsB
MSPKQLVSNKIFLFALVVLLAFLANVKYRQWQVEKSIDKEKQILTEQAEAQQKKRDELSQSLSYLNSNSFKERVARQELGLKKDGEVVFNFTENQYAGSASSSQTGKKGESNFAKWWNYFVNND